MEKHITNSVLETELLASNFAKKLKINDIVAFNGGMGAGKTSFTRGLLAGFNSKDNVSSPTFALVHEYEGEKFTVYHFDMYRVTSWDDLYSTGFFDYLDNGSVLIIEWSENIKGALPENAIIITLEPGENDDQRIITIEGR